MVSVGFIFPWPSAATLILLADLMGKLSACYIDNFKPTAADATDRSVSELFIFEPVCMHFYTALFTRKAITHFTQETT